ncbi:secondary thiamine-phosphate synthase enzyme [Fodinibius roseus]|uniref:Secondary thiamine-phosphate synthase enzyme n=1 Tax=Fodinibius roseus TaxID=1194090 RepID=A0A1M5CKN8_9BACT|nr:secondary thiamine-phosphate synthase enzyme YjbQ [Fodinibius roseus]SHF54982.1 secondary thiamine-phosphate synthase enzyme [Fodinibius roseus]
MDIHSKEITVEAEGFSDIQNITDEVRSFVRKSGYSEGLIHIFPIGSTASVSTIEFEPALVQDMKDKLEEFAPEGQTTRHGETWGDDNGFSHMRATMMGPGITVPLHDGEPVLGTWQQIVIINHDNRPRRRRIFLQVMG